MSFTKAIEIFEKLPPEKQRLIRCNYKRKEDCCALGILCPQLTELPTAKQSDGIADVLSKLRAVREHLEDLGITHYEAELLQCNNDSGIPAGLENRYGETDAAERFQRILAWMKAQDANHTEGPDSAP